MPATTRRRRSRTREIPVSFEVDHDDFVVQHRAFEGLSCSAKYRVWGHVIEDKSGDLVTPNGAPEVQLSSELVAWEMYLGDQRLPDGLQELLVNTYADEFDAAFIKAKGGMCSLEYEAMERAA